MLNSNFVKLAETLNKLCVKGYNTIDKSDIFDCLKSDFSLEWDNEILMQEINTLVTNKFIILKYQDEEVVCLAFTEMGEELINRINIARQEAQKTKKVSKKEQVEQSANPLATSYDLSVPASQNEIMSSLSPKATANTGNKKTLKTFLIGLLGGILGGGISGTIITLLVLFL